VISYTRDLANGGWRGWFVVKAAGGTLKTGVTSGEFTATVVNPQDTATSTPAVSESTQKPGLYSFLIPDAFLATHGLGSYGTVVEVSTDPPNAIVDAIGSSFGFFERTVERRANAYVRGLVSKSADDYAYKDEDDSTVLFTNRKGSAERTPQ